MITVLSVKENSPFIVYELSGLSTDIKPTIDKIGNGSTYLEIDTGFKYMYDKQNTQWVKQSCGGSGGNYYTKEEVNALLEYKISIGEKGIANGVASLDSRGIVPFSQLPDTVSSPYKELYKIKDYVYKIVYDDIDYAFAEEFFRNRYIPQDNGACSSVRNGNMYGRNYDWTYDNAASFVVYTPSARGRFASIGMAGGIPELTTAFVDSREKSDLYKALPFMIVDGMNEKGLIANANMLPAGDWGYTTGTNPSAEKSLCTMMIIRYVLDNFATAQEAVEALQDYNIWTPLREDLKLEVHFMIADVNNTYLVEFVDKNEDGITEMYSKRLDYPYMTNFYLINSRIESNGHVNYKTITQYSQGVERFNLIADRYSGCGTKEGMRSLMTDLFFTKAYNRSTDPFWYTEFTGDFGDYGKFTVTDAFENKEKFADIVDLVVQKYSERTRESGDTWQTVHSCVYDISEKRLYVTTQEDSENENCFSLNPCDDVDFETASDGDIESLLE